MSTVAAHDPNRVGHDNNVQAARAEATGDGEGGPASKRVMTGYGFWIFLISDIIMFAAFFASYAVLSGATAGGPRGADLFDLNMVALQTALLLMSSFACGLVTIAASVENMRWTQVSLALTGLLGFAFLLLEARELSGLIANGAGPSRSAFLSAFFALVGAHGLHVGIGLLWLGTMMAQLFAKGFRADITRRLLCFTLFWHALDIIWVAVFTIVYLMGMVQ